MKTIYLDFDNTMVESNKRIIEILNSKYHTSKTEEDIKDYQFNSIYPISEKEKLDMFESDEFYNGLEFKPQVLEVLNKYKDSYNFIIVSKGTPNNLVKKQNWIISHLPYNLKFIGLSGQTFKKDEIDMSDGIQIDDNFSCLKTNAALKILYKSFNQFPWQQPDTDDEYIAVNTWEEIDSILDFYGKYNCKTLEKIR